MAKFIRYYIKGYIDIEASESNSEVEEVLENIQQYGYAEIVDVSIVQGDSIDDLPREAEYFKGK